MKKYAIVLFSAILASCFAASAQQLNSNIVTNPGFENGTATWSVETARITSAEAHSGKNSLEYTNTNPDSYKLIRQGVQSKPGQVLHFSAWVKGKDINTKNLWAVKGAGIMLQGYNAKGTLVSTSTPFTLTGTFDWKQVEGIYMVPNGVSKVMVCLYFRQKTFGTAWFDDISVQSGSSLSINGNIQSLAANIKSNLLSKLSSVNISSNTSTVDKQGFTLVNGSRFFPIGIYLAKGYGNGDWASTDDNLARISKAGFNTILDYMYGDRAPGAYLTRAQNHNLKVIYCLSDFYDGAANNTKLDRSASDAAVGYVDQVKNSSNLLAYYVSDENGQGEYPSIAKMYQKIKTSDPRHLVFQVNNSPELSSLYANVSDVSGSDPYVISGNNFSSLSRVTDWTKTTVQTAGNNSVWQVVQIFDKTFAKPDLPSHPPTLNEMRNMAYQSIIAGAKGLMFFSYHNLFDEFNAQHKTIFSEAAFNKRWPDVAKTIGEVNDIIPVVLKNNKVAVTATGSVYTKFQAWEDNGKLYLMIANPNNQSGANTFNIPGKWICKEQNIPGVKASISKGSYLLVHFTTFGSGVVVLDKQQ